ncbi:MAG: archaetidylserine synthase [Methanobrevibacter sp.]|nr:archaetidylserine synthase [Methanobrevibacter sp.]
MEFKETGIRCFLEVPDVISLLNLLFGFLAILMAINNQLSLSATFIILALVFDSVDGWVARKLSRVDKYGFGKNIDSLADVVSFGVAPGILLYSVGTMFSLEIGYLTAIIALFIVICGVLRLTRFNVIADFVDSNAFIGLPIPVTGFLLATFILSGFFNITVAMVLMVIIGVLMISNIKYAKFYHPILLPIIAVLVLLLIIPFPIDFMGMNIPAAILFIITLGYICTGLINHYLP